MRGRVMVLRAAVAACVIAGLVGCSSETNDSDGAPPRSDASSLLPFPAEVLPSPRLRNISIDNYPRIDGSTSTLPLARVIACELLGLRYEWLAGIGAEGIAEIVPVAHTPAEATLAGAVMAKTVHNKTHQAYLNLVDRQADMILVASEPSADELDYARARGVRFEVRAVARDALVFVVNHGNRLAGLSSEQLRHIFLGVITRWEQIGAVAGPIQPYVRPPNSGSQQLMDGFMKPFAMPAWPEHVIRSMMGALLDSISGDPGSIGYSVYYYVTYQHPNHGYRVLALDGVAPVASTIAARTYPATAEVWAVTRTDLRRDSLAYQLREWLLTPSGQRVVSHSGYVPVLP